MPIFYSALTLTGVNLLLRLVSTSFQVFISGQIGAAGVGLLQLVLSVGMLSTTAAMAGIRTTTMYLTAEEIGRKQPGNLIWVLSGCFGYSIVCSSTIAIALYALAPVLAEQWIGHPETASAIRLVAGFLPVNCLCGVMTGYFTAANRIGMLAAVEVVEQIISMAATTTLLLFWSGQDPAKACQAVVLGSGISSCITLICLVCLRLREPTGRHGKKTPIGNRLLQSAVPLALADDLKSGISTAENIMVPKRLALCTTAADPLALFGTVCGMVFPVLMFPAAILFGLAELLIPELARCAAAGSRERIQYLVGRSLRICLLYGLVCCGLLFLLAEPLCLALYRSTNAGIYLRGFSLLAPMLYCDAIVDAMTKGLGQQRACVRYNILTSGLDVVALYFLLPVYGMNGYFFSFLVTHLLNFILSLRRLLKISGISIAWQLPVLSGTATLLAVWAASHLRIWYMQVSAYALLLGILLFLLQVLTKEDIFWIKSLIKRPTPKKSTEVL